MTSTNLFRLGAILLLGGVLVATFFLVEGGNDNTISDSERRELRSYYEELNSVTRATDDEIQALQVQYSDANDNLDHARLYYQGYVNAFDSFIDKLRAMDPPDAVRDQHLAFVNSTSALQALNRGRLEDLLAATDVSELQTIFQQTSEYNETDNRRKEACATLGDIATANRIDAPSITSCRHPIIITATVEPASPTPVTTLAPTSPSS